MERIAAIIPNYNMPERAEALYAYIVQNCRAAVDIYIVDNGSDIVSPSKYTTLSLSKNVQTTKGWMLGLLKAVDCAKKIYRGEPYFAYWFLITSAEFVGGDPLSPMVDWLRENPDAVGIHPALTEDSTTNWTHLITRGGNEPRRTWMIDNIASLYRADWFDEIGRFDVDLIYGWGIDLETCWKARQQGRSLWVDERSKVRKTTNIGYTMGRMNMTAEDRTRLAWANMEDVLMRKYGPGWWFEMTAANIEEAYK